MSSTTVVNVLTIRKAFAFITAASLVLLLMEAIYFVEHQQTLPVFMKEASAPLMLTHGRLVVFDALKHLGGLEFLDTPAPGWLVVVINYQTPKLMDTCPNCTFVSAKWADFYLHVQGSTPTQIKMATYLYLLSLDPLWIYVTNKAQRVPYKAFSRVVDRDLTTGPVHIGPQHVFEPCHHFVDPYVWQGRTHPYSPPSRYSLKNVTRRSVYYVVDECFQSDVTEERWKDSLDQRIPIPYVMPGTFAVLDFNNALISQDVLWTLVAALPSPTMEGSALSLSALKLNMVVQRILWETRHHIGFLPGIPHRKHCSVCSMTYSFETLGQDLQNRMSNWRCKESDQLLTCLMSLAKEVIADETILSLVNVWQLSLNTILQERPKRDPVTDAKLQDKFLGRHLFLSPAKLTRYHSETDTHPVNTFGKICQKDGHRYKPFIPGVHGIMDILLLVPINHVKHVDNIPMVEYLYGRHFRHVIYMSLNIDSFVELYQSQNPNHPVSYVTMPHANHAPVGTATTLELNYDVEGVFQISDDVLVNLWNFYNVPLQQPWFQYFIGLGNLKDEYLWPGNGINAHFSSWHLTKAEANLAWDRLHALRDEAADKDGLIPRFIATLNNNTKCDSCIFFGNADIFYVPRRLAKDFAFFARFLESFNVHFEVSVVSIMGGLVDKQDIYRLSGKYVWHDEREELTQLYRMDTQFYHPLKFSELSAPESARIFCQHFLHNLDLDLRHRSHNYTLSPDDS